MGENPCRCLEAPPENLLLVQELESDVHFADISVLQCQECGRYWLRYFYELEAFSRSGRWYLGMVTPQQLATLSGTSARRLLEQLDWYHYGGSYFDGQTGKRSGALFL